MCTEFAVAAETESHLKCANLKIIIIIIMIFRLKMSKTRVYIFMSMEMWDYWEDDELKVFLAPFSSGIQFIL